VKYDSRTKTLSGLPQKPQSTLKQDDVLAYSLSRHFKYIGSKSKLQPSLVSAAILVQIASHFNEISRFEEANLYAKAALTSACKNHIVSALAMSQLLYSLAGLQKLTDGEPDESIISLYREGLGIMQWHWGYDNLCLMTFYDRMSAIFHKANNPKKALDYHQMSLEIAEKSLGKNHIITAGYLTRVNFFFIIRPDVIFTN
jgi:hypothetical protein